MEDKIVYRIKNIEEYGKLMAYCIEHDIRVWRTYWDEREKDTRCYFINWDTKNCLYSPIKFWESNGFKVVEPVFDFDEYGTVVIKEE